MVKIEKIMKKKVITVDPDVSVSDAAKIMTNNRIGSLIILQGAKPVGIVTTDDLVGVIAGGKNPKRVKLRDIPKRRKRLISVGPDEDIIKVTKVMIKNGVKRVPVIKNGRLMGIVSDKEILLTAPELLEVLSEKLRARVDMVAQSDQEISGICEECEAYSDELRSVGGRWLCEDCRGG